MIPIRRRAWAPNAPRVARIAAAAHIAGEEVSLRARGGEGEVAGECREEGEGVEGELHFERERYRFRGGLQVSGWVLLLAWVLSRERG